MAWTIAAGAIGLVAYATVYGRRHGSAITPAFPTPIKLRAPVE